MARPPAARDKVLTAFATIVVEQGESAATMEAVAAAAGVSKGGLLYHFGSREALVDGLVERLLEDGEADAATMRADPTHAVEHYLASSAQSPRELNALYVAASRITQTGSESTRQALAHIERLWLRCLIDAVGDEGLARLIALVGDGLYLHAIRGEDAADRWRAVQPVITALLQTDRASRAAD